MMHMGTGCLLLQERAHDKWSTLLAYFCSLMIMIPAYSAKDTLMGVGFPSLEAFEGALGYPAA